MLSDDPIDLWPVDPAHLKTGARADQPDNIVVRVPVMGVKPVTSRQLNSTTE